MTQTAARSIPSRTAPFRPVLQAGMAWIWGRIEAWRRQSRDRAALARMNMRQLDDLPIEWPEDLRHIRRS